MKIAEMVQKSLLLASSSNAITENVFKLLIENVFAVLTGNPELHNVSGLYNSKPDVIKELYAALLSVTAEFVRTGQSRDLVAQFLQKSGYTASRINFFVDLYEKHLNEIKMKLINIGNHLPHITDVTWKIDYIIKSSCLDTSQGPLFRIGLQIEKNECGEKKVDYVNFTCDRKELQDLVYKLKDAVRHCQRIGSEH